MPSEKTLAYRNCHVVRAASKIHILEDCTTRTNVNWMKTNIKQATTASKSRQGKTSTKCRHLTVGTTEGVPFSNKLMHSAVTTSEPCQDGVPAFRCWYNTSTCQNIKTLGKESASKQRMSIRSIVQVSSSSLQVVTICNILRCHVDSDLPSLRN